METHLACGHGFAVKDGVHSLELLRLFFDPRLLLHPHRTNHEAMVGFRRGREGLIKKVKGSLMLRTRTRKGIM